MDTVKKNGASGNGANSGMCAMCQAHGGACSCASCHGWGGQYRWLRILIGIVVMLIVFSAGVKLGEWKGIVESQSGYYGGRMMAPYGWNGNGGYGPGGMMRWYYGNPGSSTQPGSTTAQ